MKPNKRHQSVKYLFKYNDGDIQLTQICVYDHDNDKIFIRMKNEFKKNYTQSRISKKIIIPKRQPLRSVCKILKDHAENLKDDPERLSTKFLQSVIGIECK